jgi:hypothetical protein
MSVLAGFGVKNEALWAFSAYFRILCYNFWKNFRKPRLFYTSAGNFTRWEVGKMTGGWVGQIAPLEPP